MCVIGYGKSLLTTTWVGVGVWHSESDMCLVREFYRAWRVYTLKALKMCLRKLHLFSLVLF